MAHIVDVIKYEGDSSTFVWKHPLKRASAMNRIPTFCMIAG